MEKRNLYIIVAIVLVVGLVISFGNLTGRGTGIGECRDSDDGDKPSIGGSVSYTNSNAVYKDECYGSGLNPKKFVREYFCTGRLDSLKYICDNGCTENAKGEGYCLAGGYNVDHSDK